ncbi:MarR family transcriptional regulator [Microbacterium sp. BWT-B31]|uniref:MarR family winged helix-turn-helix transcriptional regulator n=1 Tax=Microbacterium sp. BWT-B31 TaxID=3232072 RepID=UPI003527D16A
MASRSPLPVDPIAEARRQWIAHGWADAAEGVSVVTSIMRAHQLVLAEVDEALRPHGLSFARYEMLRLLAFTREGRMPMASATARLQVHAASVTNVVRRLEADGLLRREPHPHDGRAAMLELTDAGRRLTEDATATLNETVFSRVDLDADELTALVGAIARMRERAGDFRPPRPTPDPL